MSLSAIAIAFGGFLLLDAAASYGRWIARQRAQAIAIAMGHPDVAKAIQDIDA